MDAYLAANQALWDTWTSYHIASQFYNVVGFKAGRDSLTPLPWLDLVTYAANRCSTCNAISAWTPSLGPAEGPRWTGTDFSEEAITAARALATELHLHATFVHSDLYDLPQHLTGQFDVVFTSYGVLGWLPDLKAGPR